MYATNSAALLHKYQSDSVMTASPMELIIMLYDALIKQIKLADIFMERKDHEKSNQCLSKAQEIVSELLISLDLSYSLSQDLMRLYDYMLQELIQINIRKDRERIPALLEIIGSLREAWGDVRKAVDTSALTIEE